MNYVSSAGLAAYKLAFQLSPIVLVNGIAGQIGGMLPIIAITEAAHFLTGILSGTDNIELDNFFAHFEPAQGSTLIDNQIGTYPFANQAVAANAIIRQPLALSMIMKCPPRDAIGVATKLATMMNLRRALDQHNSKGGTYTVVTPSCFYTNGIMTGMRDVSSGESKHPQSAWQIDFQFPLLTLENAAAAQNSLMQRLTSGSYVNGAPAWSGLPTTITSPNALITSSLIPASSGLPAANTAPFSGIPGMQ